MSKIIQHYLKNADEREKLLGEKSEDIFIFSEHIDLLDDFCSKLYEEIQKKCANKISEGQVVEVHWYKTDNKAIVCISEKFADYAIKIGKEIIIQKFDNTSTNYISKNLIPALEDYKVIAAVETDNIDGLKFWCKNYVDSNNELLIKTKEGLQYILAITKYVDDFRSKLKSACVEHRFRGEFDFTYNKFKIG